MQIAHYINERALRALWQKLWLTFFSETTNSQCRQPSLLMERVKQEDIWFQCSLHYIPLSFGRDGSRDPADTNFSTGVESTNNFCRWSERKAITLTRVNTPLATFLRLLFRCLGYCLVKQRTVCIIYVYWLIPAEILPNKPHDTDCSLYKRCFIYYYCKI